MQLPQSDLDLLRTQPQKTTLYLSIYNPRTILTCQISDPKAARESMYMTHTNAVGDYSQAYANMLGLVGTSAGDDSLGHIRVRRINATGVAVAENSDILWASGTYLTLVNYIELDAIYPKIVVSGTKTYFYKDTDIPYTTQNYVLGTIPCAGPHRAAMLKNNQPTQLYWSSSGTVNVKGNPITFSWFFEGGTPTGSTLRDPGYISYAVAGDYKTVLQVYVSGSTPDTTMRFVSIKNDPNYTTVNAPITKWELMEFTGSRNEGGYTAKIRVRDTAIGGIKNNALVTIFTDDWYGSTNKSIGGNAENCSNIFFVGYIIKDTIYYNYQDGYVEFDVASSVVQMKDVVGFSISVQSKVTPKTWYEIVDMDIQRGLYHYLKWQSTVLDTTDFRYTGPNYPLQYFDTDRQSLYDAINNFLKNGILGLFCADRQGMAWAELDALGTTAARTAFPVNIPVDKRDWIGTPQFTSREYRDTGYVTMGGVAYSGAHTGTSKAFLACAPGISPSYRGKVEGEIEGLILTSQLELNQLVGNWFAETNSPTPQLILQMAGNYRNLDITPIETTLVNISKEDTPKEIVFSNEPFHNVGMEWKYDGEHASLVASKYEMSQLENGIPGDTIAIPPPTNINIPIPPIPPMPVPPVPPFPVGLTDNILGLVNGFGIVYTQNARSACMWESMNIGFPDPTLVSAVEVSLTGKCYAKVGFDSVWFAPFFGAAWTKIIEAGSIPITGGPPDTPSAGVQSFAYDLYMANGGGWGLIPAFIRSPIIAGIGINRGADDELMVIGGVTATIFSNLLLFSYYGSSATVKITNPNWWNTNTASNSSNDVMRITFGGGTWVVSWEAGGANSASLTQDGSTCSTQLMLSPIPIPSTPIQTRSAVSPQTSLIMDISNVAISNSNGSSWSLLSSPPSPYTNSLLAEAAYTNPAGNVIALATFNGTYGTVDGGSTWAQWMATSGTSQIAYWNLNDNTDFLYTEVGTVKCTGDFGVTKIDLTGNLSDVIGSSSFIVSALRTY